MEGHITPNENSVLGRDSLGTSMPEHDPNRLPQHYSTSEGGVAKIQLLLLQGLTHGM